MQKLRYKNRSDVARIRVTRFGTLTGAMIDHADARGGQSPESLFQTPTPLLFQNFSIRIRVRKYFKFENPTPVQTPATIDPTEIYPCFCSRNDHEGPCYCRNWKVTPGPVFHKFLTSGPNQGPKDKRKIQPESTPALRIHGHLWRTPTCWPMKRDFKSRETESTRLRMSKKTFCQEAHVKSCGKVLPCNSNGHLHSTRTNSQPRDFLFEFSSSDGSIARRNLAVAKLSLKTAVT